MRRCFIWQRPAGRCSGASIRPRILHPSLEVLARLLVEALEDLIDLRLVLNLTLCEMAPLRDRVWSIAAGDLTDVDCVGLGRGGV